MQSFVLVLVSFLFFLKTYSTAPEEISSIDVLFLSILLSVILLMQLIILRISRKSLLIEKIIFSLFGSINIFSIHIILFSWFLNMGPLIVFIAFGIAFFILFTIANIIQDNAWGGKAVSGLLIVGYLIIVVNNYSTLLPFLKKPDKTSFVSENVQHLEFVKKPNVYFLAFDSLIPRSLMSKHLDINDSEYHRLLDENVRSFKNTFSDASPTKPSLNSLMALDHEYFLNLPREAHFKLYNGHIRSPLFEAFSKNGYVTNTLYNSKYFGKEKGAHIDNYWVNIGVSICEFFDEITAKFFFFNYCNIVKSDFVKNTMADFGYTEEKDRFTYMLRVMQSQLKSGTPQLFLTYTFSPGHTKWTYVTDSSDDYKEFQEEYKIGSKVVAQYLIRLFKFMKKYDPSGVVVLIGDHGALLSRTSSFDDKPEFYIQDRYGIFGGIYPKNACKEYIDNMNEVFVTPTKIASVLLECVSGGGQVFKNKKPIFPLYINEDTEEGIYGTVKFEDFLYE